MIHSNGRSGEVLVLHYGGEHIPVEVSFRNRKDLAISVHPDCRVEVLAPSDADLERVLKRATRRASWIVRQRRFFEQHQPKLPPRRYVSGETHHYLGRQYRLKVKKGSEGSVKLVGGFFHVIATNPRDASRVAQLLDNWYRAHARAIFAARVDHCLRSARSLAIPAISFVIRKMTRRWGSCTKAGIILLNPELVRVSVMCIDYVIMHELCHVRAHNHGPEFYRLLSRCMPDWERRKSKLDSCSI